MQLSIPEQHQLRIAKRTLKLNDAVAKFRMLGGPNKEEAREIIKRLEAKKKQK
jgi:hypothetical protein